MKYILCFLLVLSVGCSSAGLNKKAALIDRGDSIDDVRRKIGPAENRQINNDNEAWQYCETTFGTYHFLDVIFYYGKVAGVRIYQENGVPFHFCGSMFTPIRFEDAPSSTVEIRNR